MMGHSSDYVGLFVLLIGFEFLLNAFSMGHKSIMWNEIYKLFTDLWLKR